MRSDANRRGWSLMKIPSQHRQLGVLTVKPAQHAVDLPVGGGAPDRHPQHRSLARPSKNSLDMAFHGATVRGVIGAQSHNPGLRLAAGRHPADAGGVLRPTCASTLIRRKSPRNEDLIAEDDPTVRESPSTNNIPRGAGAAETPAGPVAVASVANTTAPAATRALTTNSSTCPRFECVADPMSYRPPAGSIPPLPGVYRFRDSDTRVVYVGKATNLRSRLSSYFQSPAGMHPRTAAMVQTASSVDWVVVDSETEALQLEYQWIKQFAPRFNVKYRDDKSYPYLAITMNEQYPRVLVMRGDKRKGSNTSAPMPRRGRSGRLSTRSFGSSRYVRSNGVFRRSAQMGRPCLLGYIGKCSAPCVGRISEEDHRELAGDLVSFLGTGTDRFMKDLENRMRASSQEQDYETAARLRDDLGALRKAMERSALVLPGDTNADLVGHVEDDLEAAFQVFHVRAGRVRGQHAFVLEKVADESPTTLMTGSCSSCTAMTIPIFP